MMKIRIITGVTTTVILLLSLLTSLSVYYFWTYFHYHYFDYYQWQYYHRYYDNNYNYTIKKLKWNNEDIRLKIERRRWRTRKRKRKRDINWRRGHIFIKINNIFIANMSPLPLLPLFALEHNVIASENETKK